MSFTKQKLTDFGAAAEARTPAGQRFKFSRVAIGDGVLGNGSMTARKTLISEKMSIAIEDIRSMDNLATVVAHLTNQELDEGFYYRELGVYCLDPITLEEGLYSYDNCREEGEYIGAKDSGQRVNSYLRIKTGFLQAEDAEFPEFPNPLYALRDELQAKADLVDGVVPMEQLPPLDPAGTAAGLIAAHNASAAPETHADIRTDLETLRSDMESLSRFKGYVETIAELADIPNPTENDYAWVVEFAAPDTGPTVWTYTNGAWVNSHVPVPDQALPLSDLAPLMDGVATPGTAHVAVREGHRHPTDITRAAAADVYTKLQTLSAAAKTALGLASDKLPTDGFEALSYVTQHVWQKMPGTFSIQLGATDARVVSSPSSASTTETIYYTDSVAVDPFSGAMIVGEISMLSVSYNTYTGLAALRGKYWSLSRSAFDDQNLYGAYYSDTNANYTRNVENSRYWVYMQARSLSVLVPPANGREFVYSHDLNAYPQLGLQDGDSYAYVGKYKREAISPMVIGTYIGTGATQDIELGFPVRALLLIPQSTYTNHYEPKLLLPEAPSGGSYAKLINGAARYSVLHVENYMNAPNVGPYRYIAWF